ncbi:fluoride efflux transporter CrcB [Tardiphaga sp. 862_B3_N1_1]|uniref:fluoride efflux transporter CrcB n=1 Tax=Tardiphaga sp. 862_B3_N1_1 TaxID=3240763 RepID=UPI003F8BB7E1
MWRTTLVVAAGGALGSVLRFWISLWLLPISKSLPWSTILTNVIGSFAIALFAAITALSGRYPTADLWRNAFMVGVCGGFTTFSSFSLQSVDLIRAGAPVRALLNIGISVALCLAAASAGYLVADWLSRPSPR